jgi:polysaccharide biosynthesis protein PslH
MRVVAVSLASPLPLDNANAVANWGLFRAIARRHEASLFTIRRPGLSQEDEVMLQENISGELLLADPMPSTSGSPVVAARRLARGIMTRTPRRYLTRTHPEIADRLQRMIPKADVIVLLDNGVSVYEPYLRGETRSILHIHNVDGWSSAQSALMAHGFNAVLEKVEVRLTRSFERRTLPTFTRVTVTSQEESDRLAGLYGRTPDAVIPSSVDLLPQVNNDTKSPVIGWLGDLGYGPNRDGLIQFLESGWSALAEGGVKLLVAGSCEPEYARLLTTYSGVEILGYVDDLVTFLSRLSAGVVPLWSGAGVKLKTLTMMAAGVPLAVTPVAIEGIAVKDGQHCLIAQDGTDLARKLIKLLGQREEAERVGAAARGLVSQCYAWDVVGARFLREIECAAGSAHNQS